MFDRVVATVVVGLDGAAVVGLLPRWLLAVDSMGPIQSLDHIYAIARAMYIVCPLHCK